MKPLKLCIARGNDTLAEESAKTSQTERNIDGKSHKT